MKEFSEYERNARGAIFSPCETYRYLLWRLWGDHAKPLVVCMLNPSTADAEKNDPTVERCERRARAMGRGGLIVVNLFALRSTDPTALYRTHAAIGPANDLAIEFASKRADEMFCGWGNHGSLRGRDANVLRLLAGVPCWAWAKTKQNRPQHPLYVPYKSKPIPLNALARSEAMNLATA